MARTEALRDRPLLRGELAGRGRHGALAGAASTLARPAARRLIESASLQMWDMLSGSWLSKKSFWLMCTGPI